MNPFLIRGPAVISFSGGRTSALMLRRIIDAHGGRLPPDVIPVFANTGKERPETLDFVERCSAEWDVEIVWVELCYRDGSPTFQRVNYATASRNGEPFGKLVEVRNFLPNPVTRFCTQELKIRPMRDFALSLGWDAWTVAVGIRADEPWRIANSKARRERYGIVHPLHVAGVTLADVSAFWAASPFDLALRPHEGNCDLCFLKGGGKIQTIMRGRPDLAAWWIDMETRIEHRGGGTGRFRRDRPSYAGLLQLSRRPGLFDADEPDGLSAVCSCTD